LAQLLPVNGYCLPFNHLDILLTSTALAEDEVVGTEEVTKWTCTDSIHCAGLQVDEDSSGNIFVARRLRYY